MPIIGNNKLKIIVKMAYFVIAGKPSCAHFVHCIYMAEYLDKHLPHFKFRTIQLEAKEWQQWLLNMNKLKGWFHMSSPLIWKEISYCGGKPYLIGGISDFWEYVYDYYGLQSVLPTSTLQKLLQNNIELFKSTCTMEQNVISKLRHILIHGAANPMVPILLSCLNDIPDLRLSLGINFILYQNKITPEQEKNLQDFIEDFKIINNNIELTSDLDNVMLNVDLIIYTENYLRDDSVDDYENFLIQNTYHMKELGLLISKCGKRGVRIVLANHGPVCFNANILLSACSMLRPTNIIAVTADHGLRHLTAVAAHYQLPLTDLGAPPVWGSIELTKDSTYVDLSSVVQRCIIHRPYSRALRVGTTSTLALGTIQTELRMLSYLTDSLDMEEIVSKRQVDIENKLGRKPFLAKVRSTVDVIKMWYEERETGDIISLGVASDGSFDLPNGLYFSQPVMFKDQGWKPVSNFPLPKKTKEKIRSLVKEALHRVEDYII